jgi:hypothetical protein
MGNHRRIQRLTAGLILAGAISHTNGQEQTTGIDVSPTPTQSLSSSDGASATKSISGSETSSTDVPLELWGIANGLLSSYYPSTTISNVASLTWPSVVVIDSSTYTRNPPTTSPSTLATAVISSQDVSRPVTTNPSTPNEAEPTDTSEEPASGQPKDRTLGIALGVVFGVLALGLMAFALLCIHHRQKKHGGTGLFPSRRRRAGSPTDSEVGAWRARHPHMGLVANFPSGRPMTQVRDNDNNRPSREWVDRYNRLEDQRTPPAHLHPAFLHRHNDSVGTISESNPFFPPAEHQSPQQNIGASVYNSERNEYHPGYPKPKSGFNDMTPIPYTAYKPEEENRRSQSSHNDARRRSSFSSERSDGDIDLERNSRPPTPFSPMMMLQTSLPPFQRQDHLQLQPQPQPQPQPQTTPQNQPPPNAQQQQHQQYHRHNPSNPFTSTEDPTEEPFQPRPQQQYQTLIPNHPHAQAQGIYQDEEDDDIVSPMLQNPQSPPSKSPARRYSPLVHYPSWSEVSEFDFTGESSTSLSPSHLNGRGVGEQQQQQRNSRRRSGGNGGNGDGDAYGRDRESVVGRWELA